MLLVQIAVVVNQVLEAAEVGVLTAQIAVVVNQFLFAVEELGLSTTLV